MTDFAPSTTRWFSPTILALFVGSGCAALIYEVVWFQLLQLTIGSTTASLGLLLATFMGGMSLGALVWPRLVSQHRHPLRVYAVLELSIGLLGIASVFAVPALRQVYVSLIGHGYSGQLLRGLLCAACLLPPTILMGATLPAIARWVEMTPRGMARLGLFYGGNTTGGVVGCLLAGFYLLRVFDLATAAYFAVAMNFTVAAIAVVLAARMPFATPEPSVPLADDDSKLAATWPIYAAIALSGATALGAEVIWTRLLSLMLSGTTYAFSIILASFLVGIGLGGTLGSWWCGRRGDERSTQRNRSALGVCQILIIAAIFWAAIAATQIMPKSHMPLDLATTVWQVLGNDLLWCAIVILPAAVLWGACFPLALASAVGLQRERGRLIGEIYAANTAGAIIGAVVFSLFILPQFGTQQAQQILTALAAATACLAFLPLVGPWSLYRTSACAAAILIALLLGRAIPQTPFALLAHGRYEAEMFGPLKELYRGEGTNATIAVSEGNGGVRSFHISGRVEASSSLIDMRTQRMIGALPAVLHPEPKSVLVVGFGAGVTAGSFLTLLDLKRIVICEIEPLIPHAVGPFFDEYNLGVADASEVEIVYDDARHFMLTTDEKFDVITSDPVHPWLKGAAALYTVEYFQSVKERLNPGGVVSQWIPLYESNTEAVKSALVSFFEVFPHGSVWTNAEYSSFYDLVLVGTVESLEIDLDAFEARMNRPAAMFVRQMLQEVDFDSPFDLLTTYAGHGSDLKEWLRGTEANRDRNLRLQYLAGITPRGRDGEEIHRALLSSRQITPARFPGSEELRERMRRAIAKPKAEVRPEPATESTDASVEP